MQRLSFPVVNASVRKTRGVVMISEREFGAAITELAQAARTLASQVDDPALARRLNEIAAETLALIPVTPEKARYS